MGSYEIGNEKDEAPKLEVFKQRSASDSETSPVEHGDRCRNLSPAARLGPHKQVPSAENGGGFDCSKRKRSKEKGRETTKKEGKREQEAGSNNVLKAGVDWTPLPGLRPLS